MELLKVVLGLVVIGAVGFYVIVNHSEIRQELVCRGHWKDAPTLPETAYLQLNEYRWWVRLWSDRRGNAKVQTDKRAMSTYFSDVRRLHEGRLAIYTFHDENKLRGGYRAANRDVTIELLPTAIFIGTCDG